MLASSASALEPGRAVKDADALVRLGPRVTGTPAGENAARYLEQAFQAAGYATEIQTFTYSRYEDRDSKLVLGGRDLAGNALQGAAGGRVTAPLVLVPNFGAQADYQGLDVRGKIAVTRRGGDVPFAEKVRGAEAGGAVGVIVINSQSGRLQGGTLGRDSHLPALGLPGSAAETVLEAARRGESATLESNARRSEVTGRNVIARLPGVQRPDLLLGGHYDSVPGAPGANDNASGVSVVLEVARSLRNRPEAQRTWFVAFDGEEDGLRGSRAFVQQSAQVTRGLEAMLNFDMVGINAPGLSLGGSEELLRLARQVDPGIGTFEDDGRSDHSSFLDAGVPAVFFFRGIDPNYHQPGDTVVDGALLDQTADFALKLIEQVLAVAAARP
nr:M28 family metallopeptidase [Deinobacterium chartae]